MNRARNKKIIIILSAVVVIAVGYLIWLQYFQSSDTPDETPQASSTTGSPETELPADSTSYLVIDEWGVKLPLADTISDAQYYMQDGEVLLTTAAITKACTYKDVRCSIATLTRTSASDAGLSGDQEELNDEDALYDEMKVGEYYYQFDDSNAEGYRYQFANSDTVASALAVTTQGAFAASFQQIASK